MPSCLPGDTGSQWGYPAVTAALIPCLPCPQAARAPPPAGAPPAMAIVQTLPVPLEAVTEGAAQLRTTARPSPTTMGSVGSLLPGRPRHDRTSQSCDREPPAASFQKQEGLLQTTSRDRPSLEEPGVTVPGITHAYANGGFCGDWFDGPSPTSPCSDSDELHGDRVPSDHLRGPPPKLVPVSGKLEEVRRGQQQGGRHHGLDFAPHATLRLSAHACELEPHGYIFGVPGKVVVPMPLMPPSLFRGSV